MYQLHLNPTLQIYYRGIFMSEAIFSVAEKVGWSYFETALSNAKIDDKLKEVTRKAQCVSMLGFIDNAYGLHLS